ncbi:MAG: DsbA family protein [Nitrososphaerales archaeon]
MSSSKKGFAIIAMIVGVIGIAIGVYTISAASIKLSVSSVPSIETGKGKGFLSLTSNDYEILGSSDAPITIIEFGDYQCPNCMRFAKEVKPLLVENYINLGKVKLVFKDFTIYGTDSISGALATHCAAEQKRYWEMHDYIYANQEAINSGWLRADNIKKFAYEIGLEIQQFSACFDERRYNEQVMKNFEDGKSVGVKGTPTFIIVNSSEETQVISGAQPFGVFKQVLDEMLVR